MNINDINNKNDYNFTCIYLFKNLINNKVYVGQAQNFYNRIKCYRNGREDNRLIGNALKKYGFNNFDIIVLEKDIPIESLNDRESYWIKYYNSCVYFENGWGYNMTEGGEGTKGHRHSQKTKQILSEIRTNTGRPVICIETNKIFDNMNEASKWVGLKSDTSIGKCCRGELITAGGYHWKYVDDDNWKYPINKSTSPVVCIETNQTFDTMREASKFAKVKPCNITAVCMGLQNTAGGYHWRLLSDNNWKIPQNHRTSAKKIKCIETNKVYEAIKDCASDMNIKSSGICANLKQQIKSYKGYHFIYIN